MNTIAPRQAYLDAYRRIAPRLPGRRLPWLGRLREYGLAAFAAQGFPAPRGEAWKYTSLAAYAGHPFQPPRRAGQAPAWRALVPDGADACRLVFVDGHYRPELSRLPALPQGVVLDGLARVLDSRPGLAEPYLGEGADGLQGLNAALFADGAVLYLPPGAALETPIHLLFLAGGQADSLILPRNLLIAEAGSQATVIEHYAGPNGSTYFTNAVTEIAAAADSRLVHCKLQEEGGQALHIAHLGVRQGRASRFDSHALLLGGALNRNAIHVDLDAERAACGLYGLHLLDGKQHADSHTRIEHRQPRCASREFYKGVLGGQARGVFSGSIVVRPGAQQSDARQINHNLLLSERGSPKQVVLFDQLRSQGSIIVMDKIPYGTNMIFNAL